jgi:hypothetical protein
MFGTTIPVQAAYYRQTAWEHQTRPFSPFTKGKRGQKTFPYCPIKPRLKCQDSPHKRVFWLFGLNPDSFCGTILPKLTGGTLYESSAVCLEMVARIVAAGHE